MFGKGTVSQKYVDLNNSSGWIASWEEIVQNWDLKMLMYLIFISSLPYFFGYE